MDICICVLTFHKTIMGFIDILLGREPIDTSKLVIVEATPYYKNHFDHKVSPKLITHDTLLRFAKSKKLDRNYLFETSWMGPGWKFEVKKVLITNRKSIRFEIKFTPPKNANKVYLEKLRFYTADGFHKTTHAGDPFPLTTKNNDIYVMIPYANVKVFQNSLNK
jgi:hypothetical protein